MLKKYELGNDIYYLEVVSSSNASLAIEESFMHIKTVAEGTEEGVRTYMKKLEIKTSKKFIEIEE